MKVKKGDIVKLGLSTSSPRYTYLVLETNATAKFESGEIKSNEAYIKVVNLTRLHLEDATDLENQFLGGRYAKNETYFVSKKGVTEILININTF